MTGSKLVILERYHDAYSANIVRGLLETNGISCVLFDDQHAQNVWWIQSVIGVRIMVAESDLTLARTVLEDAARNPLDLPDGELPPRSFAQEATIFDILLATLMTFFSGAVFFLPKRRKKPD
jgi:hypothetical protein